MLVKFRVEDGLKHLMQDQEFRNRVIRAYEVQVEQNHGWGFTVRYRGYRIRFDIDNNASKPNVIMYRGYDEEKPFGLQKTLEAWMEETIIKIVECELDSHIPEEGTLICKASILRKYGLKQVFKNTKH